MAIKYKVIEKAQPGVVGGGIKKYYAASHSSGEVDLKGLSQHIEMISTVSGADIMAVVYALVESMQAVLEDGRTVRLGELGSLRVSLKSRGENSPQEVGSHSIIGGKTIFTPGKDLKKMLKRLKYNKV